tara:strand:+ start:270 stop:1574 length:1305 start_codon:yes stop_codon:yes gene_type:complete
MKKNIFNTLVIAASLSSAVFSQQAKASPWNIASTSEQLDQAKEIKLQEAKDQLRACYELNRVLKTTKNCNLYTSTNKNLNDFEKALQLGAIYVSKLLPTLNSGDSGNSIKNTIKKDATSLLVALGNDYINDQIQTIPFLSQTQLGVNFTSGADTTFYLNSNLKLANLGEDENGSPRGILFAQGNVMGTSSSGVTTNIGLGARKRINDNAMIGLNAFWDYRMTSYSTSYSRWGAGGEIWWNDFKLTNNWYIAGTGIKRITTSGPAYIDESDLAPGTYSFSEWAGANTYNERVVPGWDVGLNYRLPNYPQLSLAVRGFRWDYIANSDDTGVEGSINWQATPRTNLTAWVSNENPAYPTLSNAELNRRDSDIYFGVRFNIQLQPVKYASGDKNLSERLLTEMAQPVARRNDVLLERWKPDKDKTIQGTGFENRASGI